MYKYKFSIYFEEQLVFDSQEKEKHVNKDFYDTNLYELVDEGLYDMDDVAWDIASETRYCLFETTTAEDSRYTIEVEEIEVEDNW